jgi:two-component system, cell cycle sensor histidine kinase and response regulator CckA
MRQHYLFAEHIPHMVWVARPGGDTHYFNRLCEEYTGLSYQLLGQGWRQVVHPDDLPHALERWARALATGRPYEVQYRLRRADGAYRWHVGRAEPQFDERGRAVGWVGTCTDIEEQKRAEAERDRLLARLRLHVERLPLAYVLLDADFRVAEWNPAAERLFGFSRGEALGRSPFEFMVPPKARAQVESVLRRGREGDMAAHGVNAVRTKGGEIITCEWFNTPLWGEDGRFAGHLGLAQDVTERLRLEEQFLQAQKMEAVGRLAGGVAHDFNNLLTVINGSAAVLLRDLGGQAPAADSAQTILKASERAAGLTRQLLAFSRKQIVAPRVLDLNAVVADAEAMLRRLIGEDVVLATDLQPGLRAIRADPTHLGQVLLNLAVNARDAMPAGGRLSVATRDCEQYVLLAVADTGCGMTEEVRRHLFEPFFTTKGPGQGTGLGLSTVYGIVKQAGGHIEVESQPGMGTTVRVYWPRSEEAPAEGKRDEDGRAPRGSETVLLAEDEDEVRALVRQVLMDGGYAVLEARDGAEALWLADRHGKPIDLLVTDVVMPGLDGRGLAERLGRRCPALRVLYLSGHTDDAVVRHGVSRDKAHFLQKPFSPVDLARKVREVLDAPDFP